MNRLSKAERAQIIRCLVLPLLQLRATARLAREADDPGDGGWRFRSRLDVRHDSGAAGSRMIVGRVAMPSDDGGSFIRLAKMILGRSVENGSPRPARGKNAFKVRPPKRPIRRNGKKVHTRD